MDDAGPKQASFGQMPNLFFDSEGCVAEVISAKLTLGTHGRRGKRANYPVARNHYFGRAQAVLAHQSVRPARLAPGETSAGAGGSTAKATRKIRGPEGFRIRPVERSVGAQAFDEIGVGDLGHAKRHCVRLALGDETIVLGFVEATISAHLRRLRRRLNRRKPDIASRGFGRLNRARKRI